MRIVDAFLWVGLSLVCLSGCSGYERPELVEVTGTVTLDGSPVAGAIVAFQPVADEADEKGSVRRPSAAVTDAEGKFSLGTYEKADGVPPGKYLVGIQKREMVGELPPNYNEEMPEATPVKYAWVIPKAYADPNTSGLTAEVTSSGLEPAVFALDSGGAKPVIEIIGGSGGRRANEP